ncbi:MAG: hypothetical protein HFH72_08675 [Lachnospiraceae bacterium]|nr:hypothetical protein [Lachnospiraceae bacterium]
MEEELIVKIDEVEIYDNDFEIAMAEACQKFGIDDLTTTSQRRWKRVMEFVGKRIFRDNKILRDKNTVWIEGNSIPTNNNRFDYNIINILCDYYMSLSDQYDKLISAEAFSLFLNIPRDTIGSWKDEELSSTRFHIYKKLKDFRLECIKDNSYDNGNVTGTMYVGNVEYGTNLPGVREDSTRRRVLTAAELPKLGGGEVKTLDVVEDGG